VGFSRLSTGTKLASKIPKKIQKSVRFRFSTGTKSSKTAQKNFSKNRQDVFSTPLPTLKIKKNFKVGSGYCIRGIPVYRCIRIF
jgi:hypothetical protein